MSIVAPEQRTAAPPQEPQQPAQPATRPWITATRKRLVRRFPSLGFAVHTGGLPNYEVLLATDPALLESGNSARRSPASFYSSRQDGGLRTSRGDDEIYLHDLIGMTVELDNGERVGDVTSYYELPQGLTLDVSTARGSVLVPYRPEVVERTDGNARVIVVKADVGLFE
jgi:hypothetical protein